MVNILYRISLSKFTLNLRSGFQENSTFNVPMSYSQTLSKTLNFDSGQQEYILKQAMRNVHSPIILSIDTPLIKASFQTINQEHKPLRLDKQN